MTKNQTLLLLTACLMPFAGAQAAPSSNVAWTVETHKLMRSGDPAVGAELETVETEDVNACTDCHGKGGAEPDRDKHPTLAGQVAAYTFKQLKDYKDGTRENRRMNEAVERLSDEQLAGLAAWFAEQPLPQVEVDADETVSEQTVELVFRGDKTRLIQPCAACHGRRGQGAIIDVPSIAGQNVKYFVETMKDYAKDKRTNDIYGRMRIIAKSLTREEIDELAVYYARLGNEQGSGGQQQAKAD
ncbi:MAG: cytochrome c4 [Chromatiaceae bacterium]|nr:cytochrome c4 [Gammaproteobacteria bacterium]MCP5312382.1 cytochrome c4 [Chromatiaceae bacterium]